MSENCIGIGVIGLGHWGPNHVRVFTQCEQVQVLACADPDEKRRRHVARLYPGPVFTARADDVFARSDVDAVVIATPTTTHYRLARAAIEAGKHVLLEKPMCLFVDEAEELVELSTKAGTVLVNGHVFVYNRGIQYLRDGTARGDFGAVHYLTATRTNLGPIRADVNVIQDLAAHEITIFDYLLGTLPCWVAATGSCPLGSPREDVAFVSLEYPPGVLAHIHVSWLSPQKMRTLTLVGSRRMVCWDDIQTVEPVRIYDKGVTSEPYYDSFGEFQMRLRDGDILAPKVELDEPLRLQADAFLRRIRTGAPTLSEADRGVRVVRCLAAIQQSLQEEGRRVYLSR